MGVTSDNESVGDTDFNCKVGETFLMFLKLHLVSWNVGLLPSCLASPDRVCRVLGAEERLWGSLRPQSSNLGSARFAHTLQAV